MLAEQGIEIGQGRARVRAALPGILEEGENGLSGEFRELVQDAYETLVRMDARLDELEARIARWAKADEQVQRLLGIPGIGPITATALLAAVGGRGDVSQWTGVGGVVGAGAAPALDRGVRAVIGYQQTGGCLRARLTDTRRLCGAAGVGQEDGPAQPLGTGCRGPATSECGGGGVGQPHGAHRLCVVGQRGGLPGRPRAANGLSGGQAAGQGMTRWTRQQTAEGNRFQALRSDMNVMATNKATLPGWEPERDTGAHDSDCRYCDKDTTARNPSGPAGIVPCNQEAGYMAAMPLLSTRTWRLQYGGEPYMSPEQESNHPFILHNQWVILVRPHPSPQINRQCFLPEREISEVRVKIRLLRQMALVYSCVFLL